MAIVCGVVWGLGPGFGIVAFGTLLGEVANYLHVCFAFPASVPTLTTLLSTFRYMCSARAEKLERTNVKYGLLAYVVRREGFLLILLIRLSVIPPHCTS